MCKERCSSFWQPEGLSEKSVLLVGTAKEPSAAMASREGAVWIDAFNGVKMAQLCVFAAVEAVIAIVEPNGPSSLPVRVVMRANPDPAASVLLPRCVPK